MTAVSPLIRRDPPATSVRVVRRALRRAWLSRFFYRAAFAGFRGAAGFVLTGGTLALADRILPLSRAGRAGFWCAGAGLSFLWAAAAFGAWRRWRREAVAREAGKSLSPSDDLANAWDLVRRPPDPAGTSPELVARALEESARRLASARFGPALRPPRFRLWFWLALLAVSATGSGFLLLPPGPRAFLWRSYFPFGPEEAAGVAVSPGDLWIEEGGDFLVRLEPDAPSAADPELWVQGDGLRWERCPLDRSPGGPARSRLFQDVRAPLKYRARHRGRWTPVYSVGIYRPLRFESLRVEHRFPRYTGRAAESVENSLALRALRGGRLRLSGRFNQKIDKASALLDDGRSPSVSLKNGRDIAIEWDVYGSGGMSVRAEGPDRPASLLGEVRLTVEAVPDEPPAVRILAPAQDLLAAPREEIPLVFEVSDDFGTQEVRLNYRINDGETRSEVLRKTGNAAAPEILDARWRLGPLRLKPGDRVRYFLSARDNNTLTGPGEGVSASFLIETASYESEHRALEERLGGFRRELTALLGDQVLAREKLEGAASPEHWKALAAEQSRLRKRLAERNASLESLLAKMERDPLMDQAAAAEYGAMAGNLRDLERDAMARAEAALTAGRKEASADAMDEAVSELERFSLLAEDVLRDKRLRDTLHAQEDLTRAAESLVDRLAENAGGKLPDAAQRDLAELMDQAERLMQSVVDQIRRMPQELPEDFVNQEAIKNLRFDEVQSALEDMRRALQGGDAAGALAQARKMLERLKEIQKTLNDSARKTPGGAGGSGETLLKEVQEGQKRLQALVERQENLKARTQALSRTALDRLSARQREQLKSSADQWDAALAELDRLAGGFLHHPDAILNAESRTRLPFLRIALDRMRQEVRNLQVRDAAQGFREMRAHADPMEQSIAGAEARALSAVGVRRSTAPRAEDATGAGLALAALEALKGDWEKFRRTLAGLEKPFQETPPEKSLLLDEERKQAEPWPAEQGGLAGDARALRRDLQVLSRRTATLGTALPRNLRRAAEAMDRAQADLSGVDLRAASGNQETALRHLRDAQDEMDASSQVMGKMEQFLGQPAAGSIQSAPERTGGASGAGTGPVRIPKAEDFRPPKEFREEILRSMKEKYPKSHERVIQDYYDRWAK